MPKHIYNLNNDDFEEELEEKRPFKFTYKTFFIITVAFVVPFFLFLQQSTDFHRLHKKVLYLEIEKRKLQEVILPLVAKWQTATRMEALENIAKKNLQLKKPASRQIFYFQPLKQTKKTRITHQ